MQTTDSSKLLKMSELARRSGVPAATIKHYVREGLLPEPKRTSRNMAWYDEGLIPRIQAIKELQRTRFLPLKVIKEVLEEAESSDKTFAEALQAVLRERGAQESRTREELLAAGVPEEQLEWFVRVGLVTPEVEDGVERYSGDDLAILKTLGAARRAGLTDEMLPYTIMQPYFEAVRELVRVELKLFRKGVVPHAEGNLAELVHTAAGLSEGLVMVLRRKLLLPTLEQIVAEEGGAADPGQNGVSAPQGEPRGKGPRKKRSGPSRKR